MAQLPPRLYFAYGSSLSTAELQSHCPTSTFYSIAVLRHHRWLVNEHGYANIMASPPPGANNGVAREDVVWGVVYTLRPFDEELLDKHEGLPWAYAKEEMDVEAISIAEDGRGTRREVVRALVYIDRERVQESSPRPEFVVKMNQGIHEAMEKGVPRSWVDRVVRGYIHDPAATNGGTPTEPVPVPATPLLNVVVALPAAKPESDRASQSQASVVGHRQVNHTPLKTSPQKDHPISIRGLDSSRYAQESKTGEAADRPAFSEREGFIPGPKRAPVPKGAGKGSKSIECWWWKVKGSCRRSEADCYFAHHITGVVADAPGKKLINKAGFSLEQKGLPYRANHETTQTKSVTSRASADKENNQDPFGASQHWGEQQGQTQEASTRWGDQIQDGHTSWSDQVENVMDKPSEWLASNERSDVKW